MIPTIHGLFIAAIGLFLMFRRGRGVMDLLQLEMLSTLMGGSAAMILSAIGGSSVPPAQFALLFGLGRIVLPGSGRLHLLREALQANVYLCVYCIYGVFAAIFAPVMFRGMLGVAPMRGTGDTAGLFDTVPLAPSPQNITASVYIMGSLCAGIIAYVAMQEPRAGRRFVKTGVVIVWVHVVLGVLGAVLKGTPFDLFITFMRNANYVQHSQTLDGFVRITGIFPEPSGYVGFGFPWFVFMFECWVRDILPRRTGPAALVMALVLLASTSSTAYVGFAGYGAIFALRTLMGPQNLDARKGLALAAAGLVAVVLVSMVMFLLPQVLDGVIEFLRSATVDKQQSESGLQRAFWAKIGIDAFFVSSGFGVGPGSFRSSSFLTAVLGSVGIVGAVAFTGHMVRAFKPLAVSTYAGPRETSRFGEDAMIGVAAVWAAVGLMIPAAIVSPTCDPGADFAVFTAVAIALRKGRAGAVAHGSAQGSYVRAYPADAVLPGNSLDAPRAWLRKRAGRRAHLSST